MFSYKQILITDIDVLETYLMPLVFGKELSVVISNALSKSETRLYLVDVGVLFLSNNLEG